MEKRTDEIPLGRRDFLRLSVRAVATLLTMPVLQACKRLGWIDESGNPTSSASQDVHSTATPVATRPPQVSPTVAAGVACIALVRTRDRRQGVQRAISLLGNIPVNGKHILLKPNFNSADPPPASTHPDTLRTLIESLQAISVSAITVADRSGMGDSRQVMKNLGIDAMSKDLGFELLILNELTDENDWTLVRTDGDHWQNGFPVARRLLESEAVVQTCCLKPHRFGGYFTLSLKNSVGLVGKYMGRSGYNYMSELHSSSYQRSMIAEINSVYNPALVVLDGVEAFIDDGPERGTKVWGDVILAGTDRVAIDAVGLAILRALGYRGIASQGPIFVQEQIRRAVELGLGIDGTDKIEFVTDDSESSSYASQIRERMLQSG
jgi:uncharacterized protein (DUF362 family)